MSTLFLVNPASGRKDRSETAEQYIRHTYHQAGEVVSVKQIDFDRLDEDIEEALGYGIRNIYAVGGDGTVNAVGTRLINRPVNFGVIPQGSGNGYARNIGFSINLKLAVRQSLNPWVIKVDTAQMNGIPFLNVAGVGLDAEVAWNFAQGGRRGFWAYARSSMRTLIGFKPRSYHLVIDGKPMVIPESMGIVVANGTQWGYDAKVFSRARITDGLLDVLVIRRFPFLATLAIITRLFGGSVDRSRFIDLHHGRQIHIRRASEGLAQIDGEPIPAGCDLDIQILPNSLNLLLPNSITLEKVGQI